MRDMLWPKEDEIRVKIGESKNAFRRDIRTGCPGAVVLLVIQCDSYEEAYAKEQLAHRELTDIRHAREFFLVPISQVYRIYDALHLGNSNVIFDKFFAEPHRVATRSSAPLRFATQRNLFTPKFMTTAREPVRPDLSVFCNAPAPNSKIKGERINESIRPNH